MVCMPFIAVFLSGSGNDLTWSELTIHYQLVRVNYVARGPRPPRPDGRLTARARRSVHATRPDPARRAWWSRRPMTAPRSPSDTPPAAEGLARTNGGVVARRLPPVVAYGSVWSSHGSVDRLMHTGPCGATFRPERISILVPAGGARGSREWPVTDRCCVKIV